MASWVEAVTLSYRPAGAPQVPMTSDSPAPGGMAVTPPMIEDPLKRVPSARSRVSHVPSTRWALHPCWTPPDRLDALQRAGRDRTRAMPDLTAGDHR
jgi:hypothetical protein